MEPLVQKKSSNYKLFNRRLKNYQYSFFAISLKNTSNLNKKPSN